ncbi:hypothetical protein FVEN_g3932 [Fusarium venenatum]|uniref:AA1-like domain-containing protein n=1 Tax=Fusarium venenatum TaxID=56646 RepID=A0A2L2U3I0_9HYPO|nr:uncharacterized protein FVRRES_09402 [Fusarium venenatum]KAG8358384.1 hypothetical protein FVEN_g3932 [Fusarium venenatum]KAH6966083.1 hypothetical protein EDB82DRAFT_319559 [Fusarium venenatum]CEI69325.1 unnamed protein product [Fusarium venenatum]
MKSSIPLALLGLAPYMAQAQKSTTKYSSTTVFIPPVKTGSATDIYASIIASDDSSTKYLLGCQTALDASTYSCDNDFSGITYTRYASSIDVQFGVTSFGCETGNDRAICVSKTATGDDAETRTLTSSESSLWMTAITFVDVKKRKTTATHAQETESSNRKLCKRKVRDHVSGGSDSESDSGSGTGTGTGSTNNGDADADADGDSGSSVNKKPNNNNDQDCSAASIASLSWAAFAMGFGGYLGLNLA